MARPSSAKASGVAAAGATPWPQSTAGRSSWGRLKLIGTSPPGPFRCGSTICRTKPQAAAAPKALPPHSSTAMPAAAPSQWVAETAPKVPRSSGRVVKPCMFPSAFDDALDADQSRGDHEDQGDDDDLQRGGGGDDQLAALELQVA